MKVVSGGGGVPPLLLRKQESNSRHISSNFPCTACQKNNNNEIHIKRSLSDPQKNVMLPLNAVFHTHLCKAPSTPSTIPCSAVISNTEPQHM